MQEVGNDLVEDVHTNFGWRNDSKSTCATCIKPGTSLCPGKDNPGPCSAYYPAQNLHEEQ